MHACSLYLLFLSFKVRNAPRPCSDTGDASVLIQCNHRIVQLFVLSEVSRVVLLCITVIMIETLQIYLFSSHSDSITIEFLAFGQLMIRRGGAFITYCLHLACSTDQHDLIINSLNREFSIS